MITQNPIVGRSRKKLAGVYARTLWGKNIIQSLPCASKVPASPALRSSRDAFGIVVRMSHMVPAELLPQIYYTAPTGRSRRAVLTSQLMQGVIRNSTGIVLNETGITQLGTNPISSIHPFRWNAPSANFRLPISSFGATEIADTSRIPLILAISFDLKLCDSWLYCTSIDGNDLVFNNISDTFIDKFVWLFCLWQVNIGTSTTPIWVYGSYEYNV